MNLMEYIRLSPEEKQAHDEITANRRHEAWLLHNKGYGWKAIGDKLGISNMQAKRDVLRYADEVSEEELRDLNRQRAMEYGRLEQIIEDNLPDASLDPNKAKLAAFAMTRKAKMLGLDAPTKFQHAVMNVRPKKELTREEVDAKLLELYDRLTSRNRPVSPQLVAKVKQLRGTTGPVIDAEVVGSKESGHGDGAARPDSTQETQKTEP